MSTRQIRRFRHLNAKKQELEEQQSDEQSDESDDFAPSFSKVRQANINSFNALKHKKKKDKKELQQLSAAEKNLSESDDDTENEGPTASEEEKEKEKPSSESADSVDTNVVRRKKSKNKKKIRLISLTHSDSDDNVERAVAEVNKLLGSLEPCAVASSSANEGADILRVDHKYLDPKADLSRLLGPIDSDKPKNRGGYDAFALKRRIQVLEDKYTIVFKGLTMEKIQEEDGIKYFRFKHEGRYESNLRSVLEAMRYQNWTPSMPQDFPIDTLEGFLQSLDFHFYVEESSVASRAMEGAITFVQTLFAPAFSYFDGKTRLEYKHVENRPFHLLLFKYVHLLTNKACHRTALEIAKILLNLDPSDPLALIFIIDVVALRARQFEWLLELYKTWARTRDAARLFNMVYSRALAQYNLHLKTRVPADLETANEYIREAIISYPNVGLSILKHSQCSVSSLTAHTMSILTRATTSEALRALQALHCLLVWPKWREAKGALAWLLKEYRTIVRQYDLGSYIKEDIARAAEQRSQLFLKYPLQVKRHLATISPLSQLIAEGAVPAVERTISFNPFPLEGESEDPRRYYFATEPAVNSLRSFLTSIVPQLDDDDNDDDD